MVAEKEREVELREYTEEMIKKMLKRNVSLEDISVITDKSIRNSSIDWLNYF